jgi:hypothetical protein
MVDVSMTEPRVNPDPDGLGLTEETNAMTYLTSLIGRFRKMLGMGTVSSTAPQAPDPPSDEPAVPPSTPERPIGPTVGSS